MAIGSAFVAAILLVLALYHQDPATSALFPPCPFHLITGLHCPGCGTLRGIHALLHGDFAHAFALNPLTVVAAPFLLLGVLRESFRLVAGHDPLDTRVPAWSIRLLLVAILSFGVLRNLQPFAWLAPH